MYIFIAKKSLTYFPKGCCRVFPFTYGRGGGQVLGGDGLSFSKPVLNFPWLALSHSLGRHLIESVLKGFHCVFPQTLLWTVDTFTVRMALVEDAGVLLLSLVSVTIVHASEEAACSQVKRRLRQTGVWSNGSSQGTEQKCWGERCP